MLIRNSARETKTKVAMREGPGSVLIKDVCAKEDLYEKSRLRKTAAQVTMSIWEKRKYSLLTKGKQYITTTEMNWKYVREMSLSVKTDTGMP